LISLLSHEQAARKLIQIITYSNLPLGNDEGTCSNGCGSNVAIWDRHVFLSGKTSTGEGRKTWQQPVINAPTRFPNEFFDGHVTRDPKSLDRIVRGITFSYVKARRYWSSNSS